MSDVKQSTRRNGNQPTTFIGKMWQELMLYVFIGFIGWLIAITMAFIWWYSNGATQTILLFGQNLQLQMQVVDDRAYSVILWLAHIIVNEASSVQQKLLQLTAFQSSVGWINNATHNLLPILSTVGLLVLFATLIISLKLLVVILFSHLLLIFIFLAIIDGLVLREVRRYGNARESSAIYHQWRKAFKPILLAGFGFYLLWPYFIAPEWVLIPTVLLASFTLSQMIKTYKKYL